MIPKVLLQLHCFSKRVWQAMEYRWELEAEISHLYVSSIKTIADANEEAQLYQFMLQLTSSWDGFL